MQNTALFNQIFYYKFQREVIYSKSNLIAMLTMNKDVTLAMN